ncbi:MAG: dTDP-4-dehydrorhamnose reductase [Elusimicrobia bacterium]|nr:dTDP-4-dehydrorhamnose reductase [Elusimicrobiota bacterium]MBD3412466.1 dTDP-4-dehydrorhamnose reductase [Elusimicrobiota bacterium]
MRVLLTGSSGMLGSDIFVALEQSNHEVLCIDAVSSPLIPENKFKECDITDQKKTYHVVSRYNPDVIVHTAAYTDVDGCEQNPDKAFRINALGTRNLLLGAQRFDASCVYISTDYVFGSDEKQEYDEFDRPNPVMQYARSKYAGEEYVRQLSDKFFIVRISSLFGRNRNNFVLSMMNAVLKGKPYTAAHDMIASPTYSKDLAKRIVFLIEQGALGTYHLTNAGNASRYQVGLEILRLLGKKSDQSMIKSCALETLNLPAKRPKSSILKNYVWELNNYPPARPWQEALRDLIDSTTKGE